MLLAEHLALIACLHCPPHAIIPPPAEFQANPWWAVKLPAPKAVVAVAVQTTSECACVADLVGARILVGSAPWAGPASGANYTLCAAVKGIVRGQRQLFTCAAQAGAPPVGQYIAIWRPSAAKRQLTLCEVDAVFAEAGSAQSLPGGGGASGAGEQPPPEQAAEQPAAARRRRMLGGLRLRR